ncbi:heterokaryon incompatibility protein-domain-containing protein [Xylaria digitata]|nr:heterokaryon incompatibility protein-domain-containing protein [Xylaria digitata]
MSKAMWEEFKVGFHQGRQKARLAKAQEMLESKANPKTPKERPLDIVDTPDHQQEENINESFTYRSIEPGSQSVRLLQLLPGTQGDICCQLETRTLAECAGTYEALSYVWAPRNCPAHLTTRIQVDDKPFLIHTNLRAALLNLREAKISRTLWVDALCIDQSNVVERSEQVSFMGDIYRSASGIVVWLGEIEAQPYKSIPVSGYKAVSAAFSAIEELATEAEDLRNKSSIGQDGDESLAVVSGYIRDPLPSQLYTKFMSDDSLYGIILLGENDWWYRAWTCQEILLSRRALVKKGEFSMPWDRLVSGINHGLAIGLWSPLFLGIMASPIIEPCLLLFVLRNLRRRLIQRISTEPQQPHPSDSQQLLDNLVHCRFRDATDRRDKVYGVLGLNITAGPAVGSKNGNALGITPDYSSSTREVYCHVARRLIIHSRSLDLLGSCTPCTDSELPTWVPDWGFNSVVARPLTKDAFGQLRSSHASLGSKIKSFEHNGNDIVLQGHELTVITVLAPVARRPLHPFMEALDQEMIQKSDRRPTILGARFDAVRKAVHMLDVVYEVLMSVVPQLGIWADWDVFAREVEPQNPEAAPNGEGDPMSIYWQTLSTGTLLQAENDDRRQPRDSPVNNKLEQNQDPTGSDNGRRKKETIDAFFEWRASLRQTRHMHQWRIDRVARPLAFLGYVRSTWRKISKFSRLLENTYNRRLARCGNGYLALVPEAAQQKDRIFLVEGGMVPLVLREEQSGSTTEKRYRLVGEAYVHGVMNGEAFKKDECTALTIG